METRTFVRQDLNRLKDVLRELCVHVCAVYRVEEGGLEDVSLVGILSSFAKTDADYRSINEVQHPRLKAALRSRRDVILWPIVNSPENENGCRWWGFRIVTGATYDAGYALFALVPARTEAEVRMAMGKIQSFFATAVKAN